MNRQLTFPACVIPGCPAPVGEWGDACAACVTAFGDHLRIADTRLTEQEIDARDRDTRSAYAIQREAVAHV